MCLLVRMGAPVQCRSQGPATAVACLPIGAAACVREHEFLPLDAAWEGRHAGALVSTSQITRPATLGVFKKRGPAARGHRLLLPSAMEAAQVEVGGVPASWSIQEVGVWLSALGLPAELQVAFAKNAVDGG